MMFMSCVLGVYFLSQKKKKKSGHETGKSNLEMYQESHFHTKERILFHMAVR